MNVRKERDFPSFYLRIFNSSSNISDVFKINTQVKLKSGGPLRWFLLKIQYQFWQ